MILINNIFQVFPVTSRDAVENLTFASATVIMSFLGPTVLFIDRFQPSVSPWATANFAARLEYLLFPHFWGASFVFLTIAKKTGLSSLANFWICQAEIICRDWDNGFCLLTSFFGSLVIRWLDSVFWSELVWLISWTETETVLGLDCLKSDLKPFWTALTPVLS